MFFICEWVVETLKMNENGFVFGWEKLGLMYSEHNITIMFILKALLSFEARG